MPVRTYAKTETLIFNATNKTQRIGLYGAFGGFRVSSRVLVLDAGKYSFVPDDIFAKLNYRERLSLEKLILNDKIAVYVVKRHVAVVPAKTSEAFVEGDLVVYDTSSNEVIPAYKVSGATLDDKRTNASNALKGTVGSGVAMTSKAAGVVGTLKVDTDETIAVLPYSGAGHPNIGDYVTFDDDGTNLINSLKVTTNSSLALGKVVGYYGDLPDGATGKVIVALPGTLT